MDANAGEVGAKSTADSMVMRFAERSATKRAPADARLPEFKRDRFAMLGRPGERDAGDNQALARGSDVNIMYVRCDAGAGFCSHEHPNWEVIIPLSGRWQITCDNEASPTILEPWDVMIVPGGIYHDAKNIGDGEGYLMGVNPGNAQAKFTLHPTVVERLRALDTAEA